jgi:signal transduction histidine kinase/ligand-binding sensor domain-containing protein
MSHSLRLYKNRPRNILYLVILLTLISTSELFSQALNFSFRNLSINDGLSYNTVSAIFQDSKGRIWIGTGDGLNLYDGSKFKIYKHVKTPSLLNNQINKILEDTIGRLWIGTASGLNIYDPETDIFNNINKYIKKGDTISSNITNICFEKNGTVWMSSNLGLYCLNNKTMSLRYFRIDANHPDSLNCAVMTIFVDSKNTLWIGTETEGLYIFDRLNNRFQKFNNTNKVEIKEINTVRSIFEDKRGNLWIGTDLYLGQYIYKTKKYNKYYYNPSNPKGPLKGMVRTIFEDNRNRLWIGFQYGLTIYDRDKNEFLTIKNQKSNPRSIAGDEVWSIMQDTEGSVWFGLFNRGISIYDYDQSHFQSFQNDPDNPNSLMGNSMLGFCEDKANNIWIGVDHAGLDYFDMKNNKFTHYRNDPFNKNSLSSNAVNSIDIDHEGILWLGTWGGGLNRFDPVNKKFTHFFPDPNDPFSINGIHIWKALEDKYNNILIATQQEGLGYYVRKENKFYTYKHDPNNPGSISINSINCIIRDKEDSIWIGTGEGINKLKYKDFSFTRYLDSKGFYINDIYSDNKGTIWVGGTGLVALDIKTGKGTYIFDGTDLALEMVLGILEDSHNNLWVSIPNKGIVKIDIANKKILKLITMGDGLPSTAFNKRARLRLTNGKMIFGTSEGLIIFHPDSLKDTPIPPKVIFTDFLIFNKPAVIGEKGSPLKKHISYTDTVVLDYNQSVFSIFFSALNYVAPDRNNYAYMLEGFEKKWNYVGKKRDATYTNLDPGEYTFRVKLSINSNLWSSKQAVLKIIVLPPYYMTWWFRTIVILIIIVLLLGIYYIRLAQIRHANLQLKKLVDERTREIEEKNRVLYKQTNELNATNVLLEERQQHILKQAGELVVSNEKLLSLNATKDKFFSLIAHDLKNPFNAILGICEILSERYYSTEDIKRKNLLDSVYESSKNLYKLLENLLQWARTQTGSITFEPEEFILNNLIDSNISLLESIALEKNLVVEHNLVEKIKIYADVNMINAVLRNLINNAIKYTSSGKINIEVIQDTEKTMVNIIDTGIGISNDKLDKIFDVMSLKTTQGTRGEQGTGLGLIICKEFIEMHKGTISVISELGKGSTFYFIIPNINN